MEMAVILALRFPSAAPPLKTPMPILTQPTPPSQRRRPWLWMLLGVSGVVVLMLVALGAESSLVLPAPAHVHLVSRLPNGDLFQYGWRRHLTLFSDIGYDTFVRIQHKGAERTHLVQQCGDPTSNNVEVHWVGSVPGLWLVNLNSSGIICTLDLSTGTFLDINGTKTGPTGQDGTINWPLPSWVHNKGGNVVARSLPLGRGRQQRGAQ
jgi:hypothetical protein